MPSSLIIFNDYFLNIKDEIKFILLRKFTSIGLKFTNVNLVNFEIEPKDLLNLFQDNTIIVVPFDNEEVLQKVKTATDVYFDNSYIKQDFGYVSIKGNKHCCIVDTTISNLDNAINYTNLKSIFNAENTFCVKLYGLSKNDVLNSIKPVLNSEKFDYTYYNEFDDLLFSFINTTNDKYIFENFKRDFYSLLGDYIYIDEPLSLMQSLTDLLQIRQLNFSIIDNVTKGYLDQLFNKYCYPFFTSFNIAVNEDKIKLLQENNLNFITLLNQTNNGIELIIIDEIEQHHFIYEKPLKDDISMKKFCNFVVFKILKKIH